MNKKSWFAVSLVVLAVIAVVLVVTLSSRENSSGKDEPITIGVIAPLSGDAAPYGEPLRDAVELVTKQTNGAGGIRERQVRVIYEDGKCEGKTASLAAQKLVVIDKVDALLAGFCSSEALAAAQVAEQYNVVLISPGASAPAFSDAGDYSFRIAPSDVASARTMVSLMESDSYKKIAIVSEQTDYAQGLRKEFEKNVAEKGLELVYDESFTSDTTDYKSLAYKINQSGAEAIMLNGQTSTTALRLATALRNVGNKMQFYVYFMSDDGFVKAGSAVEGAVVLDVDVISNESLYSQVLDSYKAMYNKEPGLALSMVAGYDAAQILYRALEAAGTDSTKVKNYLYDMPPYRGIMGNITFDKKGDPVGNDVFVAKQIRDNTLVDYK